MQNNALIHIAKIMAKWFKENVVEVINWPPYSPDLNPIEHT
jgi:transposase